MKWYDHAQKSDEPADQSNERFDHVIERSVSLLIFDHLGGMAARGTTGGAEVPEETTGGSEIPPEVPPEQPSRHQHYPWASCSSEFRRPLVPPLLCPCLTV